MKLYEFCISKYGKSPSLKMEEYEVEEKPKTYVSKRGRINKDDIGVVSGYSRDTVILTENNPSMASKILLGAKEKELIEIEERLNRKKAEIEVLKRYIDKSEMESVE